MRIRRKSNLCLNCKSTLDGVYNYCPRCGQENNNNNISFGKLIVEFFHNYLSFDSRLARSLYPFFLKPGLLTNQYNVGLRVTYVNPVRLYLVVSLFYFFVFQLASNNFIKEQKANLNNTGNEVNLDKIIGLNDSTLAKIEQTLDEDLIKEINSGLNDNTVKDFINQLDDSSKDKILKKLDSAELLVFRKAGLTLDSLRLSTVRNLAVNLDDENDTGDVADDQVVSENDEDAEKVINNWNLIEKYKDDDTVSDQMLFDSLSTATNSGFKNYLWKQYIKVRRSDEQLITNYIVENLPLMMLFLLPVFAFVLKLLYFRQKILYIKHFIHALHLHSFAYMIYGIAILLIIYGFEGDNWTNWIIFVTFVLVSTYAYISFLRVYKQGKSKTFIKFNLLGFIYIYCVFFSFLIELFLSFLLY